MKNVSLLLIGMGSNEHWDGSAERSALAWRAVCRDRAVFCTGAAILCKWRKAIPCALFSPDGWPPNRNYCADFYIVVHFSLCGWGLLSPGLFLSYSFITLCSCWFINFEGFYSFLRLQPKPETRKKAGTSQFRIACGRKKIFNSLFIVNLKEMLSSNLDFPTKCCNRCRSVALLWW